MTSAWIVVPTYDEADNVRPLVGALLGALRFSGAGAGHVLIVDDASPDGTGEIAEELAAAHPGEVHVIHRAGKLGLGRAYVDGMRLALASGADVVVQMDADLSHDPTDVV